MKTCLNTYVCVTMWAKPAWQFAPLVLVIWQFTKIYYELRNKSDKTNFILLSLQIWSQWTLPNKFYTLLNDQTQSCSNGDIYKHTHIHTRTNVYIYIIVRMCAKSYSGSTQILRICIVMYVLYVAMITYVRSCD